MKNISCSLGRCNFVTLLVIFLSLLALSLPVQSCRLNQNVLAQAASMNQRGQGETNQLNLPDREGAVKPSFNRSIPHSENMSPTSIGDQQLKKSEVVQKIQRLQMPFIANNGQVDAQVKFYANTFGGTVFVTEDGEIVYSLPTGKSEELRGKSWTTNEESKGMAQEAKLQKSEIRRQNKACRLGEAKRTQQKPASEQQPPESSFANGDLRNDGFASLNPSYPDYSIPQSKMQHVALKETIVGGKIDVIQGEEKAVTSVNYFKGKDPSKWKTNISTYDMINLGEIYEGIDLKLKAYGNNVEKLFYVKPGADSEQIKIKLSGIQPSENPPPLSPSVRGTGGCPPLAGAGGGLGARGLWVNNEGQLEVETELGPVKFTKPVAYQEINGKRVAVSVEYSIQEPEAKSQRQEARSRKQETGQIGKRLISSREKGMGRKGAHLTTTSQLSTENLQPETQNPKSEVRNQKLGHPQSAIHNPKLQYGFKVASYDKTKDLIIDPLLASTYLGPGTDYDYSTVIDSDGNIYVTGTVLSSNFPTTVGAYDTSISSGYYDVFISKLSGDLTSLLASTFLGGTSSDYGQSIAIDSGGNIYVTGYTGSSDFPTTTGAYDTSYNGGYVSGGDTGDVFISKLNGNLTSLLASTFLGGSDEDYGYSIAIDLSGNIYVAGWARSTDFPTTSGAYDTSNFYDAFISKLNGTLTNLIASTFLGGSSTNDQINSIALDSSGNIYVTGYTSSKDFPTTTGAYDTTYGSYDTFISRLNGDLTDLLASTFLGAGSGRDIVIDPSGNVYVTGNTGSSDFPTTTGAYDTSFNGNGDAFVSKLSGDLTSLLASTYLGGISDDSGKSIDLDSGGNIYVIGQTQSSNFPTTTDVYDTSHNGGDRDAFVSKLNGTLTNLIASTYLGGSGRDIGSSIAINSSGNVYVVGYTESSNFPTTTGVYDTSFNGYRDVFVSKFDSNLSASPPTVTTGNATNVSLTSATLNGTVNANGQSTTVWFQYDTASGSYSNTSSTQTVTGTSDTTVSISISGLSSGTTYYYRIAAQNSVGTVYGSEMSFTTLSDTTAPTGSIIINSNATYTNSPNVTLSLSATDNLGLTGYYLSTSSSTPSASDTGWTSVTSTNSYSSNVSYTVSSSDGNKTVYVWYKDNSRNVSSSASDSIILDTTAPVITITSPTSNTTYTVTSSVIAIGGNASDSTTGVSSVTWSNDKGGSGTASGTTSWLTSSISLLSGDNVITVTAKDGAGNSGTDTLQVTYSPSGTVTAPSASTGSATNVTSSTAIINGTVNANGASTTVWFQYGTASGSYGNTSSSQVVSGSSNTTVSISISSLSSNTTYYYRIVASNSTGTSYGSEASFATKTVSTTPTPTTSPAPTPQASPTPKPTITPVVTPSPVPTLPPLPTPIPTLTPEPNKKGTILGYIINKKGFPIESAKLRLKGTNSKVFKKTISDEDGLFEFTDLDADAYIITALKKGYKTVKQTVTLEAGEEKEIKIKMKKAGKRTVENILQ